MNVTENPKFCVRCGVQVENMQGVVCWTCRDKIKADENREVCDICGVMIAKTHFTRHLKSHFPSTQKREKRSPPIDFSIRDQKLRKKFLMIHAAFGNKTTSKAEYEKTIAEIIEMQFKDLSL